MRIKQMITRCSLVDMKKKMLQPAVYKWTIETGEFGAERFKKDLWWISTCSKLIDKKSK